MNWTKDEMQSQKGKLFLVTGANTGLGYQTALELAKKDAEVVLAGRSAEKINAAIEQILSEYPFARLKAGIVDLSSLESVREFASTIKAEHNKLDVLINNAGVMFPPPSLTKDGYELQFGVNYMAHFLLTAELFDLLKNTPNSRVVTLSSIAHLNGTIDFDNLKLEKPFDKFREYGQSKVADLIFTLELQRRLEGEELNTISVAAHPGTSKTELLRTDNPEMWDKFPHMDPNQGAFSTLYAATEQLEGGSYIGPNGEMERTGYPAPASIADYAKDETIGKQLWDYTLSELNINFLPE
jgi:NAD(P)-dependent dehydrogenase (short-subunit alcohol dehydrogenase family)